MTRTLATMFDIEWVEGSEDVLAELGDDGAVVDDGYADDHDCDVGSPIELTFANGDKRDATESRASSTRRPAARRSAASTISSTGVGRAQREPEEHLLVRAHAGRRDRGEPGRARAGAEPSSRTRRRRRASEFIDNQIAGLNAILNILYVLLALSVIV